MSDVILINQYYTSMKGQSEFIPAAFPINLLYLGTYVRERGVDCKIVELGTFEPADMHEFKGKVRSGLTDERICEILKKENPKLVGIGCMFTRHYLDVLSIAKLVKETLPETKVVLGGNHASSFPESVMRNRDVDFVAVGEGEQTFLELCKAVVSGSKDYSAIKSIGYRKDDGSVIINERRELLKNLDDLNVDYSLIDMKKYAGISYFSPYLMRYPAISIVTSRGCPNNCIYCVIKCVYGRIWRGKSAKKVTDELELLKKQYGINEFAVMDDSASVNKQRWNEICDEIIRRQLDIRWMTPNGIAHWTLDKPTLDKMKKAGCYRLTFGIESGNPEIRKYLGKPFPLEQAKEMIDHANKIGMWTICTNILGFPYETREQMEDTIRFAKKSGTDFAAFFLLGPHISSEVYKDFRKEGLLDFDHLFSGDKIDEDEFEKMVKIVYGGGTRTKYFSEDEMKKIHRHAYNGFVVYRALTYIFMPWRILRKIRSFEDFSYMMRLIKMGIRIILGSFSIGTSKNLLYPKLVKAAKKE